MHLPLRSTAVLAISSALALSACKVDNRPLLARHQPAVEPPYASLPAPGSLDPALSLPPVPEPAAYPPAQEAYAYPAQAYRTSRAVHGAPPSSTFDYGPVQPYAWDAADDGYMVAEPIDDGYRYYYYEPGADYPYFVQDPGYGYAYGPGGILAGVFTAAGILIAHDAWTHYAPRARGYWTRGYELDRAYRVSPRHHVDPQVWRARGPAVLAPQQRWFANAAAQPAWRAADARGPHRPPAAAPPRGWREARQQRAAPPSSDLGVGRVPHREAVASRPGAGQPRDAHAFRPDQARRAHQTSRGRPGGTPAFAAGSPPSFAAGSPPAFATGGPADNVRRRGDGGDRGGGRQTWARGAGPPGQAFNARDRDVAAERPAARGAANGGGGRAAWSRGAAPPRGQATEGRRPDAGGQRMGGHGGGRGDAHGGGGAGPRGAGPRGGGPAAGGGHGGGHAGRGRG